MPVRWLLVFGLLAGLDNVQAASAVGMMPLATRRKLYLALAFALCETAMLMLGLWGGSTALALLAWQPYLEAAKPLLLFASGLVIVALSLADSGMEDWLRHPASLAWMPLALSLDNLFAGLGLGTVAAPDAAVALAYGLLVLLLCLAGLLLGAHLRRWLQALLPTRVDWLGGAYLMVLAVL